MAAIDLAAIPYEADYATRRSSQHVGRLLRFWDVRNIKKDGEFMGIVIQLLDEKSSIIHGFIPPNLANQYRDVLREGRILQIGAIEVAPCTRLYVGMNSVILVTTVEPKMFGADRFLDSTPAARFFFDTQLQAIKGFSQSLGNEVGKPFLQGDTFAGIQKRETNSSTALCKFISQTNEQAKDIYEKGDCQELQMKLIGIKTRGKQYDMPATAEVAGLIHRDITTARGEKDVILHHKSSGLQQISDLNPLFTTVQHPLLFPYGEIGFHEEIPTSITMREFSTTRFSQG